MQPGRSASQALLYRACDVGRPGSVLVEGREMTLIAANSHEPSHPTYDPITKQTPPVHHERSPFLRLLLAPARSVRPGPPGLPHFRPVAGSRSIKAIWNWGGTQHSASGYRGIAGNILLRCISCAEAPQLQCTSAPENRLRHPTRITPMSEVSLRSHPFSMNSGFRIGYFISITVSPTSTKPSRR